MRILIKKLRYFGIASLFTLAMAAGGIGLAHASIDIIGENGTTGPNSENENEWDIDQELDIDLENFADADNDFDLSAFTGLGEIEENTAVEDIFTGDIWANIEVCNELNTESIFIDDLGELGDIDVVLENDVTGPFSENENEISVSSDVDIDIENNVEIDNDQIVFASTGDLEVEHNTLVGDIRTGSIRIDSNIQNIANQNSGALDFGDIGEFDVSADFSNFLTGPNSENENEFDVDNDLDVDIDNNAEIDNDLDIHASTGGTEVENNTCVGDIETGSIAIDVNVSNIAN